MIFGERGRWVLIALALIVAFVPIVYAVSVLGELRSSRCSFSLDGLAVKSDSADLHERAVRARLHHADAWAILSYRRGNRPLPSRRSSTRAERYQDYASQAENPRAFRPRGFSARPRPTHTSQVPVHYLTRRAESTIVGGRTRSGIRTHTPLPAHTCDACASTSFAIRVRPRKWRSRLTLLTSHSSLPLRDCSTEASVDRHRFISGRNDLARIPRRSFRPHRESVVS